MGKMRFIQRYCYAIFDSESSVLKLLSACRGKEKGLYIDFADLYSKRLRGTFSKRITNSSDLPSKLSTSIGIAYDNLSWLQKDQLTLASFFMNRYVSSLGPIQVIPWDRRDSEYSRTQHTDIDPTGMRSNKGRIFTKSSIFCHDNNNNNK
ncbi:unnamed protein product [Protopolystoma xenopodis]|uniref:Uncharacterized protein n=1 Tax=Protopolystoma xenopodis TaxID=117903 RepID=A0A3S4ZBJ5_9PLAT|nr:unnamed protein product [Protopolystoma xenopodis]